MKVNKNKYGIAYYISIFKYDVLKVKVTLGSIIKKFEILADGPRKVQKKICEQFTIVKCAQKLNQELNKRNNSIC